MCNFCRKQCGTRDGNNKSQSNTRHLNIIRCCTKLCVRWMSTYMQIYISHGASIGQTWTIKFANSAHELGAQIQENSNSYNWGNRKLITNVAPKPTTKANGFHKPPLWHRMNVTLQFCHSENVATDITQAASRWQPPWTLNGVMPTLRLRLAFIVSIAGLVS